MGTALQQKDVRTARLRCASLSAKLPYHTHHHEPIKLLDQAPPLVVAAVARHVTAEISDVADEALRLQQSDAYDLPFGDDGALPERGTLKSFARPLSEIVQKLRSRRYPGHQ